MKVRRRYLTSLALLLGLLVPAAVAINATPAFAQGCYANSCTGLNPTTEGCNNVSTIASVSDGDLTAQLRYSPECYAVWVKIIGPNTPPPEYGGAVDGYPSQSSLYPTVEYIASPPSPGGTYSAMVSFTYWTKACIAVNYSGWETLNCTGFH
jgi:Protein of unknown function (DUF2690)